MVTKAFILGAGLGTRLRPLTEVLPKPLVPVGHRPLVEYALDHCVKAGIEQFAINTHHLPEAWQAAFPDESYEGCPIRFFHEPVLLETGGGIRNIASFIGPDPIVVFNGDILTDLDLPGLIRAHLGGGNLVTLAVRADGPARHILVRGQQAIDIRNQLQEGAGTHQFTGVYCLSPEVLPLIPRGEVVSIIPTFLELAREGLLGAYVADSGYWLDLGTRSAYLEAHSGEKGALRGPAVHPSARVDPSALIRDSFIGPGCEVGAGCRISGSVLWPGRRLAASTVLDGCVVCRPTPEPLGGEFRDADV